MWQNAKKFMLGGDKFEVLTRHPVKEVSKRCCNENSELTREFRTYGPRYFNLWHVLAIESTM